MGFFPSPHRRNRLGPAVRSEERRGKESEVCFSLGWVGEALFSVPPEGAVQRGIEGKLFWWGGDAQGMIFEAEVKRVRSPFREVWREKFQARCEGEKPALSSWQGRREAATASNTGLPAPVALLLPPNPCAVRPFAEKQRRKRPALTAGSATRGRYMKLWQDQRRPFLGRL